MRFDYFFIAHAAITGLTGLAFLATPDIVLLLFSDQGGADIGADIIVVTRLLGAAFLGIGGVAFAASRMERQAAKRGVATALAVASLAGFVVSLQSVLTGTSTAVAWGAVAIYLTLSIGYGAFSVRHGDRAAKSRG